MKKEKNYYVHIDNQMTKIKDFLNTFNYLKDYASKNDLYETIIEIQKILFRAS